MEEGREGQGLLREKGEERSGGGEGEGGEGQWGRVYLHKHVVRGVVGVNAEARVLEGVGEIEVPLAGLGTVHTS